MTGVPDWMVVRRGSAPLVLSMPHVGTVIPPEFLGDLVSPGLALRDCDWWLEHLYGFAADLDATIVRTTISRTVIDVNRDPSGASLYPGQATTGLCPTTTFDGKPLYLSGREPDEAAIAFRRERYFLPYHRALEAEIARLKALNGTVVLYDCHSIRSLIPRLFGGLLPAFNIGTNKGASCDPALERAVADICAGSGQSWVLNGRFTGGYITRSFGRPQAGVHAVQMEMGCRAYMHEPEGDIDGAVWPSPYDPAYAAPTAAVLERILKACLAFASRDRRSPP